MVDAAVLRARVEVQGVQQAEQQMRQMGASVDSVGQKSGAAAANVDKASAAVSRSGQQAEQASGRYKSLGQGIQQLSPIALGTTGAVVGVGLAVKGSVDASIAWESSLAGVAKTLDTTGLSAAQADAAVAQMGDEIRNMAQEIPITANELAGVAEAAGQLGVAREDVVGFTETMAELGVATDLTAEQAATAIARIQNITGLAADEVDEFGNALVDLGNNSAATESEILAMATRIAAAGTNAGLTEGEILGLAAALTSVGVQAEAGGTALTQVMNEITVSVANADERLGTFAQLAGQSAEQFAASWRSNPAAALTEFVEGLGRVEASGGDTVLVLQDLGLDGIRVSQALNSVAGAGDLMADSMERGNAGMTNTNATAEETERRFATAASQIQLFKNEMNDAAISAGDELTPALLILLQASIDLKDGIAETKDAIQELSQVQLGGESDALILSAAWSVLSGSSGDLDGDLRTLWDGFVLGNQVVSDATVFAREFAAATEEEKDAITEFVDHVLEIASTVPSATASMIEYQEHIALVRDNQFDWNEHADESVSVMVELADANRTATEEGHRHNQMLEDSAGIYDEVIVNAATLQGAQEGLAGAYQQALDVMGAFNSQSSEYASAQGAIEKAVEAVQKKQEQGIPLSEKEIVLLEDHEEALGRLVGGQQDATIEAGYAALAAGELMTAQDELNRAIEDNVEDLGPYKDAVADAEEKLGIMGSTTGETQGAQGALVDTINGPLIGAIQELTRNVEYIAKPWLIEIDAATAAAEEEINRIRALASSPVMLPINLQFNGAGGGSIYGGDFASGTDPGGVSRDMLALVGEEGPELAWLPQGTHILPADETERMLAIFGPGAIPGFAEGTGSLGINSPAPTASGALGSGGGFNADAFVDIGTMIAEAINLGIELELIDSGAPTGAQFAAAIIEGATEQIDTDGDEVVDAWVVNMERIPDLAANLGQDTVLGLLEQYSDLQGELQLAILSGEDTGEIQAQIDAIFELFAAWSGNTVEEVEAVWDAVTDEARAAEAQALFESLFGSISLPGPTLSFDLEDLLSGDAEKELQAAGEDLWALYDIYVAAGMDEAAAKVMERIAALDLQDDFISSVLGTDTAQALMDEYAAQVEAADAEEAQKAAAEKVADIWETVLSVPLGELASGDYIAEQQEILNGLYEDLSIAEALGLEEQAADIRAAIEEQEFLLYAAGEAIGTPIVEAAAASLAEVEQIGADTLEDLGEIFAEYPDVAEGMIDDLIQAVADGRVPFEDAMALIAMAPEEDLIPALEDLEAQLNDDLAQALLDLGPNSPEVQAILASMGLIEEALDAAGAATSKLTDEQMALQASLGNAPGEQLGGGTGTADSAPSVGLLSGSLASGDAALSYVDADGTLVRLLDTPMNQEHIDPSDWLLGGLQEGGSNPKLYSALGTGWGIPELQEVRDVIDMFEDPKQTMLGFDAGGYTTGDGMAMLHANEYITPDRSIPQLAKEIVNELRQVQGSGGGSTTINLTSPMDGRVLEQHVVQIMNNESQRTI